MGTVTHTHTRTISTSVSVTQQNGLRRLSISNLNLNVADEFSYWATAHRGNAVALENGRLNPIRAHATWSIVVILCLLRITNLLSMPDPGRWAEAGSAYLLFPGHHLMNRWMDIDDRFAFVGGAPTWTT